MKIRPRIEAVMSDREALYEEISTQCETIHVIIGILRWAEPGLRVEMADKLVREMATLDAYCAAHRAISERRVPS